MPYRFVVLLVAGAALGSAQMTKEQKIADFLQLASTYAINYGPAQWKRDALHVDILNVGDWVNQAAASQSDLDFLEVCVAYVASLNDAHDQFEVPSDFETTLGFYTDIYDGKVLIDSVDRTQLSSRTYPFKAGDELVSIDGTKAVDLVHSLEKYAVSANAVSTQRFAAQLLTDRQQAYMPHAPEVGDSATVVVNQQSGGVQTYTIPWVKTGTPLTFIGPVVSPFLPGTTSRRRPSHRITKPEGYMAPLWRLRNMEISPKRFVVGFDVTKPIFSLPAGFKIRMGTSPFDDLYTGTFQAQGLNIGYIRIPDFGFDFTSDLETEIAYMQNNTDGLIVDVMRNPGGDGCLAESTAAHLIPAQFRTVGLEIRATRGWVLAFQQALQDAEDGGAPDEVVAQLQQLLQQVENAYATPSGRTAALPICDTSLNVQPATDGKGNVIAYAKPVMVLTDEFTASAAELFSAIMQDNQAAQLYGARTMGAGGNVNDYPVTTYSFASATVTESLMSRKNPLPADGFPTSPYIENVGVRPDIVQDYATFDNLTNHGATFVQAFSDAVVRYINSKRQ